MSQEIENKRSNYFPSWEFGDWSKYQYDGLLQRVKYSYELFQWQYSDWSPYKKLISNENRDAFVSSMQCAMKLRLDYSFGRKVNHAIYNDCADKFFNAEGALKEVVGTLPSSHCRSFLTKPIFESVFIKHPVVYDILNVVSESITASKMSCYRDIYLDGAYSPTYHHDYTDANKLTTASRVQAVLQERAQKIMSYEKLQHFFALEDYVAEIHADARFSDVQKLNLEFAKLDVMIDVLYNDNMSALVHDVHVSQSVI